MRKCAICRESRTEFVVTGMSGQPLSSFEEGKRFVSVPNSSSRPRHRETKEVIHLLMARSRGAYSEWPSMDLSPRSMFGNETTFTVSYHFFTVMS
jgi:hypothetical protein